MKLPRVSVEVLRDRDTPDMAVELAVRALHEVNIIFGNGLDIIDSGRVIPLNYPGFTRVDTNAVPVLETRADYGMVMTQSDLIASPKLQAEYEKRNEIIAGIAITGAKEKPYGIVNTRQQDLQERIVHHEFGHLMGVKNSGVNYDNEWHCSLEQCTMYRAATRQKSHFCNECADHATKYLYMRRRKKAGLLQRLFVL